MKECTGIEQFLQDIAPFFYKRPVTYVDVGAFDGSVFEKILGSELAVDEAHLIEPNERFLHVARAKGADSFRGRSVDYYQLAVGARPGRLKMHDAKSMTKVIGIVDEQCPPSGGHGTCFEVDCTTLDELAKRFTEQHISLLKIDVEGYEMEVLAGSKSLLEEQRIDVLYIEAGMNPVGTQQSYYRRIEDELASYDYRVFGVYEQTNEWLEDSPVLRRTNMAFLSSRLAQSNPYRVTSELYQANRELEALRARARSFEVQRGAIEAMKRANRETEEMLEEAFDCISRLHGREQYARREASAARAEVARVRKSFSYRLGALLVHHGRSPLGWLKAPFALWREFASHRRRRLSGTRAAATDAAIPEITIRADAKHVWVPLTRSSKDVLVSCGDVCRDLWATALSPRTGTSINAAMQVLQTEGQSEDIVSTVDQHQRHRDLVIRRFTLRSGIPARLVKRASGDVSLKLFRERGGFCVLKIELRDVDAEAHGVLETDGFSTARLASYSTPMPPSRDGKPRTSCTEGGAFASAAADGDSTNENVREAALSTQPTYFSALALEKKLWGGFARYAIPALERLKGNTLASVTERETAAWHLTRWFYVEEDYKRALDNIKFARLLNAAPQAHFALAEAQCLVKMGRYSEADVVLERGSREHNKPDFQILRSTAARYRELEKGASADQADMVQLNLLNELYISAGLSPIQKKRNHDPLHISNITSVVRPKRAEQHLKASVIIPAHNAAESLEWVIDSLLQQTWRNLEVIVVDDCSTDDTCQVVDRITGRDARVSLVRLKENGGAYAARNAGLQYASGDLITVHDSDDWSHPQRIELQVEALESNDAIVATKSHWVRVSEDLDVIGAWIPKGTVIDLNFSSLLFRREMLDVLGKWDEVLVSGDAEYYSRLKRIYGSEAVVKLPRHQLLAFSLTRESSLTRSKATHLRSLYYGLRSNYRSSYLYWHSQLTGQSEELPFDPGRMRRRFPVPAGNRPASVQWSSKYDMIVISDLAMRGGAFVSTLNYIIAACKAGKRAAVFHWRRFDLATDAPLQARLYEACMDFDIDILGPGDSVEADVVLIGYPTVLQHKIEPMPDISARHLVIVVNQYASRLVDGEDQQYDPLRVRANLTDIFGMEGVWVPISAWVKRLMQEDPRYPTPYSKPWHPMINIDSWCARPIRWRGAERHMPAIGRHGRDTYTKWPSNPDSLALVYGVGQEWDVRFLGGADHAIGMLGGRPANWSVVPFDDMSAQEFLQDLDFYVHYPHEKYIEEFGRGVMEAMALGIPAILPPQFKETFGDAATYALPDEVAKVISELWATRESYLDRARAARSFVLENCSLSAFPHRMQALLDAAESHRHEEAAADPSTAIRH